MKINTLQEQVKTKDNTILKRYKKHMKNLKAILFSIADTLGSIHEVLTFK